jgi:hypothetical protein
MTATIDHEAITCQDQAAPKSGEQLLAILQDAVSHTAELDPDRLHSRHPAGRALVALAGLAREATALLGGRPGASLAEGPGIVVVRDLVVATRLFRTAVAAATPGRRPTVDAMLPIAKSLQATYAVALTSSC